MTAMNWCTQEIESALGALFEQGVGLGGLQDSVAHVTIDSRQAGPGFLFVALKGERFDAHDFVADVAKQGALGVVTEKPLDVSIPQWVVQDTRLALGALARAWREKFNGTVLGIVGSNGKTTSKEMVASIVQSAYGTEAVCVTQGNLNNEIGVPLTLFELRPHHQVAVIEMGMNHPGEIQLLADMALPHSVLLTNAQREHQEFMATVQAVAQENGSAFLSLQAPGVAVFPAGTEFDALWVEQSKGHDILRFGDAADVSVRAEGASAKLTLPDQGEHSFTPQFMGRHNWQNAAGAAALAYTKGISSEAIVLGLEAFAPVKGRLNVVANTDQLTLIDDSYNANPDSVNAASQVLADMPGRTVLALGDMGEVGDRSAQFHQEVGARAKELGVTELLLLGEQTRESKNAFGDGATHFEGVEALVQHLVKELSKEKLTILVKGSRFMKMERIIEALLKIPSSVSQEDIHAA